MNAAEVISLIFYVIFCAQMLFFGTGFFYFAWKEVQPIKARSKVLLFGIDSPVIATINLKAEFLGLGFTNTFYGLSLSNLASGCTLTYATTWIFIYVVISAIFVRVLRLVLIFNMNRLRLEGSNSVHFVLLMRFSLLVFRQSKVSLGVKPVFDIHGDSKFLHCLSYLYYMLRDIASAQKSF